MKKVVFIGLGVMGYPMAGHLATHLAGHSGKQPKQWLPPCELGVYNRSAAKATTWCQKYGGQKYENIAAAVHQADLVLCCVGNDDDVRQVLIEQALPNMKAGAILVDHTTTSAKLAEELAVATRKLGIQFVDAPVSGGQAGAENGSLTVMCGGEAKIFQQLDEEIFPAYAKSASYMGLHGQGQRAKMVNQICISGVLRGLSEGLLLAQKSGLDTSTLFSCLKNGAAGSWQMENRAETMAQGRYDFGFAIEWMIKDLSYALQEAQSHGLKLSCGEETLAQYQQLAAAGHKRKDTSAIYLAISQEAVS